ncbi:biopolymer transporter ExbD [Hymenobacter sp. BT175]|uniref:biopolymer transporter ExbD n=1 Tax=Hymenobacter translucens TaxID=2886507 RepID=UPI001D0F021C|nr:biopolymer transporter ExbD [Hymenobacter translucens]MCC2547603.1 biopolymer transporter ExbD [Hymenobacter translucens]
MAAFPTGASGPRKTIHTRRFRLTPDMTPMVGLGFLLVTFFLLTAEFGKPTVLQLTMPVRPTCSYDGPICMTGDVLTVLLGRNHRVHYYHGLLSNDEKGTLQTTDLGPAGLRKLLLGLKGRSHRLFVQIKPTDHATYKDMVDALDEMSITDQKRYALVDVALEEKHLLRAHGF